MLRRLRHEREQAAERDRYETAREREHGQAGHGADHVRVQDAGAQHEVQEHAPAAAAHVRGHVVVVERHGHRDGSQGQAAQQTSHVDGVDLKAQKGRPSGRIRLVCTYGRNSVTRIKSEIIRRTEQFFRWKKNWLDIFFFLTEFEFNGLNLVWNIIYKTELNFCGNSFKWNTIILTEHIFDGS